MSQTTVQAPCPKCGQELRVPSSAIGKKGKCPECQTVFPLKVKEPNSDRLRQGERPLPSPPAARTQQQTQQPAPQKSTSSQTVNASCPACLSTLAVPAAAIGKKGKCPECGEVFSLKKAIGESASSSSTPRSSKTATTNQSPKSQERPVKQPAAAKTKSQPSPQTNGQTVNAACPACHSTLAVPAAALGKKGKCPDCGHVFPLKADEKRSPSPAARPVAPQSNIPPAASAAALGAGLTPIGDDLLEPLEEPALTPIEGGLQPIDDGLTSLDNGLTPLDEGLTPLDNGLTPIDDGLTPIDDGLTPLDDLAPLPIAEVTEPLSADDGLDEYMVAEALPMTSAAAPAPAYGTGYGTDNGYSSTSGQASAAQGHLDKARQEMDERRDRVATLHDSDEDDSFTSSMMATFGGSVLLILIGIVWLFLGMQADRIFFFPIFMIGAGIVGCLKNLF